MKRTPSVSPPRPFRASGVANLVAPRMPLGRARSAVAVTAVLVGVQLGLMAEGAGSDLCGLTGVSCVPAQTVFGGGVLERQSGPVKHPSASGASRPASGGRVQLGTPVTHTVALRTSAPTATSHQTLKVSTTKATTPAVTTKKGKHARPGATIMTLSVRHHRHGHRSASRVSAAARHR